ncbi:DUF2752 domain-containing protein [Roseivirga sp. BDSF3-8]|uniref:DUF2752 domain-containing protein n=1 Tax=Roseivirga sp. BDSF3-8 TaxID=3241598 RepID=UPI003531C5B1
MLVVLIGLGVVYKTFNPEVAGIFPRCPFNKYTGLQCPGCGSQRAVHHLLNLDVASAFRMNALLVIFLPYILLGMAYDMLSKPGPRVLRWRNILFGQKAILIILVIITIYTIGRNIFPA